MHLNELNRQKCTSVLSFQKEFNGVAICKLYVYEFGSETIDALIILQTMLKVQFLSKKCICQIQPTLTSVFCQNSSLIKYATL